jgi:YD repeat-containing protein
MKTKKLVHKQGYTKFVLFALAMTTRIASAQQIPTTYTDQNKLIRAPQAVTRLGADLFGDKVNLYTGALEFIQNDVSLPGNSALPVAVGRHIRVGEEWVDGALFGRWDIEIPHLHGIFSLQKGWQTINNSNARCSEFSAAPDATSPTASWRGTEYWHGSFLYVPGVGDQEMLQRSPGYTTAPTGNASYTYPIVTRNNWAIRCLPSMAAGNGASGEAFVAVSPDGTEYRFDWLASRALTPLEKASPGPAMASTPPVAESKTGAEAGSVTASSGGGVETPTVVASPQLSRVEIWILPTLVTDRFGNTVTYTYDATNRWQLNSIVANDASGSPRKITLNYETPGSTASNRVSSVSDGTRTWRYAYDNYDQLQTVTLPDGAAWQLGGIGSLLFGIQYVGNGSCDVPGYLSTGEIRASITHPSGAVGTFTLTATRHGRAGVENDCRYEDLTGSYNATYPKNFDTYALTSKSLSGPGLSTLTWFTQYPDEASSWAPCNGCNATKVVTVTDPAGNMTRHTFGTLFRENEGQLLGTETIGYTGETLRTTALRYKEPVQPFGISQQRRGDGLMAARVMEVDRRDTIQQGASFTWEADPNSFDSFARPHRATRSSSLDPQMSRTELTEFSDNLPKWILGQVKTVIESSSGKVMVQNEYDQAMSTLLKTWKFGKLQQSLTYYADGTIKTVADEKNPPTTFSNYKRGIAQRIDYPDGSFETAFVDNLGKITSLTNEANATHTFGYDAMGRLASITYPAEPALTYNGTTIAFSQVGADEYGLGSGHWKQTVTTGTGNEATYLDAFWRPVYVERWDSADRAGTVRITKHQFDFANRTTFESYPQRNYSETSAGTTSAYDGLGRLTLRSIDSELGKLYESYAYSASFTKTYTDPRGFSTSYTYQAFDQPSEDAITGITMPENVTMAISRDIFGKTKSITRSGAGLSLTRSYVYDDKERLCKTIEPETGATVQDYDLANNVSWRATGLSLPSTSSCDTTSVAAAKKASLYYDTRNRLKDTTFGDGSAAINRTYTLDGLPDTVSSNGTKWTYTYNKRRLLVGESLVYGSGTYSIGRAYDVNGSLAQLSYPVDNLTVAYNPNALGEPRQVGSYATGVTYHPTGAIAGFTYGNGIVRTLTQYVRGLPKVAIDAGVLSETYTYDKNGNVDSITDQLSPSTATRGMTYDGLNRLLTTTAPNLWGSASYTYDTLDNLKSTAITGGQNARSTVHNIDYATNRLSSITGGPANFNFSYFYDGQGNITSRGTQTYQFDLANRMTAAPGRGTYVYDGLGRRVSVVGTDSVNRIQVYSQAGQLLYTAPSGSPGTKYIYLHNHQIAEVK